MSQWLEMLIAEATGESDPATLSEIKRILGETDERRHVRKPPAAKARWVRPASEQTLRDSFATAAVRGGLTGHNFHADYIAAEAYKIADAMLAERLK